MEFYFSIQGYLPLQEKTYTLLQVKFSSIPADNCFFFESKSYRFEKLCEIRLYVDINGLF